MEGADRRPHHRGPGLAHGIGKYPDILSRERGIVLQGLLLRPARRKETKQEVYRQASATNDRLSRRHLWIGYDILVPVH